MPCFACCQCFEIFFFCDIHLNYSLCALWLSFPCIISFRGCHLTHCQRGHFWVRRTKSFLLLYQRSQQAGWVAVSGLIAQATGVQEAEEVGRGASWCLASVDTPCPSGRSPWISGTVRGQKQGGDCCRPSALPPSGRTRLQRVPTASRSTSQKPKLDSEHNTDVSPAHPPTPVPVFLWASIGMFCGVLVFILHPPCNYLHLLTNINSKLTLFAHKTSHFSFSKVWHLPTPEPKSEMEASIDELDFLKTILQIRFAADKSKMQPVLSQSSAGDHTVACMCLFTYHLPITENKGLNRHRQNLSMDTPQSVLVSTFLTNNNTGGD